MTFIQKAQNIQRFVTALLLAIVQGPFFLKETIAAAARMSIQCVLPVVAILFPTGMISALMGLKVMALFGTERLLSSLLAQSIVKEMAPSLAGIMIAAQAGSAIAGELGTMAVKEELDALRVMGVDPIKLVVLPRLIALTIICPLIAVLATFSGMMGGFLVAVFVKGLNLGVFLSNLYAFVTLGDLFSGLLKAAVFGLAIGIIACYNGVHVQGGAVGVGKAANNTVVSSILAVAILNYILSLVLLKVFNT
jgi:phospholipid/cholesterol/gamma-HCH transport system permease protein